jgi:hypothetical protein
VALHVVELTFASGFVPFNPLSSGLMVQSVRVSKIWQDQAVMDFIVLDVQSGDQCDEFSFAVDRSNKPSNLTVFSCERRS